MEKIIKAAVERGASDLHIKAGDVFRARIDGRLVALTKQGLPPAHAQTSAPRWVVHTERAGARDCVFTTRKSNSASTAFSTTTARGAWRASAASASTFCGSGRVS